MVTTNHDSVRDFLEKPSLPGAAEFHPRIVIVVIFLTIIVAIAGWRIFRESGVPRINAIADEATDAFALLPAEGVSATPMSLSEAEKRIHGFSGVAVELPKDAPEFVVSAVERQTMRKRSAAGLRFHYEGERYLLIVFRKENFFGRKSLASFPDEALLSGERDGHSFVFWENEGVTFIMVSDTDVTQVFRLVRQFFT